MNLVFQCGETITKSYGNVSLTLQSYVLVLQQNN